MFKVSLKEIRKKVVPLILEQEDYPVWLEEFNKEKEHEKKEASLKNNSVCPVCKEPYYLANRGIFPFNNLGCKNGHFWNFSTMEVLPKLGSQAKREARLVQKYNPNTDRQEYALVSKDGSKVLKWFGPNKPSEEAVKKREQEINYFKHS